MVYRAIHRNVKIAAIQLSEQQLLPLNDILLCCGFSQSTFFRILKIWWETGNVIIERVIYGSYQSISSSNRHPLPFATYPSKPRLLPRWASPNVEDQSLYLSTLHDDPRWTCPHWSQLKTPAMHRPWTEWSFACWLHCSHGPIFAWRVRFHWWSFQRRAYSRETLWEVQERDSSSQISTICAWPTHINCWSSFCWWICGWYIGWGFLDEGLIPPLDGVHCCKIFFPSPHSELIFFIATAL